MKKLISLLCAAVLLIGVMALGVVGASAADPAQTIVDVKSGDKVTYVLTLGDVPEKIVGCQFSLYYDNSALQLDSVADFTNTTDDWSATINPNLPGEIRGNWSILSGVNFSSQRNFITLNMTAKNDASAHISYYINYMYGNSAFDNPSNPAQITDYTFACDVSVNGQAVLTNAQPELNVDEPQDVGSFVNSVTGKGEDADVNIPDGNYGSAGNGNNSGGNGNNGGNNGNGGNSGGNNGNGGSSATTPDGKQPTGKSNDPGTKNGTIAPAATDAQGNTIEAPQYGDATASEAPAQGGGSAWLWIIIGLIVLIAGGGIAYFVVKSKKGGSDAELDD